MEKPATSGFTLLELLIATAIAGILLSVAVPSVSSAIQNQRMQSVLGPISIATYAARSESAKSGDTVTVCARASDSQCGFDWNNGLLVFRDSVIVNGETEAVIDPADEILRITPPHGQVLLISAVASTDRTVAGAYTPTFVRFQPDGRSNWKNGTFSVCDSRGAEHAVALHITISGSIRPARRPDSDSGTGIKDVFGRDISCS